MTAQWSVLEDGYVDESDVQDTNVWCDECNEEFDPGMGGGSVTEDGAFCIDCYDNIFGKG